LSETVIAVVPARGASKRLPRKNILPLGGWPLLYYSIRVAQLVDRIADIFVSTEDLEIAEAAKNLGARLIARPEALSGDAVTNFQVLQHCVAWVEAECGYAADLVLLLQPTQPMRTPELLKRAITLMEAAPEADSLVSVRETRKPVGIVSEGYWSAEEDLPTRLSAARPRQIITGDVFLFRSARTLKQKIFLGRKIVPLILEEDWLGVDIDYPQDLRVAEALMAQFRDRFRHFEPLYF
jgi:CMP-N-acetylneuraminic acid synthetase